MDAKGNTQIVPAPEFQSEAPTEFRRTLPMYLILVNGGIPGTMLRLSELATTLGRSGENTIQLHHSTVSRRHAVLNIDAGQSAWLTDLGSTNGTYVNGRRIPAHSPELVGDGARIQLGSVLVLKYLKLDPCDEQFQKEMFERTVRDSLTGLYNRTYFYSQLLPLGESISLRGLGLAVMMIDLDHFKQVNDTYGHVAGDRVLREVATAFRESTRSEDLVARYCGEEFVIALPVLNLEQAQERAESFVAAVARRTIVADGQRIGVTASLGLSYGPPGGCRNVPELIAAADSALYEAKREGRNRVVQSRRPTVDDASRTISADELAMC